MAEQIILLTWTPQGGTEFGFVSPFEPTKIEPGDLQHTIPSAETAGDGEYQNNSHLAARMVGLEGVITGPDLGTVQDRLNALFGAHPRGGAGSLRYRLVDSIGGAVITDLSLRCRVYNRKPAEQDGFNRRKWTISYKAFKPLWEETTARNLALYAGPLTAGGGETTTGMNWTPGGAEAVLPTFTFVVTTPGNIRITPSAVSSMDAPTEGITINATEADTWVIDCDRQVITRLGAPGVNLNDKIVAGGFFDVNPATLALTLGASNAAVATTFAVNWRQRFATI